MTVVTLPGMDDEIDRGFKRWKTERPSLDTATLGMTAHLLRLARHIELARRDVLAARELEVWEYDVLAALRAAPVPYELSPGALTGDTQVASGTMTNRIDRLSRRGYVTREPDPADRRGVLVRLTVSGRKKVDTVATDVAKGEGATWQALAGPKRAQLNLTLREVLAQFDSPFS
jgi:DNA-binding MarR family transcriptional regulator